MARLREFYGCRIVPFLKNGGKTNFGRSMWRMTVPLCNVSVRNGTTNVLGRQRQWSGTRDTNIPIVTALLVKLARRGFCWSFIPSYYKIKDGTTLIKDKEGILCRWKEHFIEEVRKAVKQMKCNKASGGDGIPAEVYKHGGTALQ